MKFVMYYSLIRMEQAKKWDTFYSSTTREPFLHFSNEQIVAILRKFPKAKSALDVGCGEGQVMIQLEQHGISTTGIDISSVALAEASRNVRGTLIEGDFEKSNFPQGQHFDLIFVKFVIAFIKDVPAFFKKINALLKTGGGLILLAPVVKGPLGQASEGEEIFVEQSVLDTFVPRYFSKIKEEILHTEADRKLSLYLCTKK